MVVWRKQTACAYFTKCPLVGTSAFFFALCALFLDPQQYVLFSVLNSHLLEKGWSVQDSPEAISVVAYPVLASFLRKSS